MVAVCPICIYSWFLLVFWLLGLCQSYWIYHKKELVIVTKPLVRCPVTKRFFGALLQCTREWDTHGTGHAYKVHSSQLDPLPGRAPVVTVTIQSGRKPISTAQLELAMGSGPPEGWTPQP
jgi:hypothetical protein